MGTLRLDNLPQGRKEKVEETTKKSSASAMESDSNDGNKGGMKIAVQLQRILGWINHEPSFAKVTQRVKSSLELIISATHSG